MITGGYTCVKEAISIMDHQVALIAASGAWMDTFHKIFERVLLEG